MRPHVGEEMSRQPSLPSLTIRGNPGADLASSRAEQPGEHHTTTRATRAVITTRALEHPPDPRVINNHNKISAPDPLTRPRSFRDVMR
jgi:hypothetical protein